MTKLVKAYERLYNGIDDMVEDGRLTGANIEEDYDWLKSALAEIEEEKDEEHLNALYPDGSKGKVGGSK